MYRIYFPLFDNIESRSCEVRLVHEGLVQHPKVTLVNSPEAADYVILCQNHLTKNHGFHRQFEAIKRRYMERAVMLDYGDNPHHLIDAHDFRWKLYFKRSVVHRYRQRLMDYGELPVIPTAYCAVNEIMDSPIDGSDSRDIDISCLFGDQVNDIHIFTRRAWVLKLAKRLARNDSLLTQIGTVSECGPLGRSGVDPEYKKCLFNSKIVLTANPDPWEGDSRTWEAISAGALVFVDRMIAPIRNPLLDGVHCIFYDVSEAGMEDLEQKVLYYLSNRRERERISAQGREFALAQHRPLNRVDEIITRLDQEPKHPLLVSKTGDGSPGADSIRKSSAALGRDVIVTIATGYKDVRQYRTFISSLRKTGATCPVLIGISDGPQYEAIKRYLLDNAVNYFYVPEITPGNKIVNGYRFEQYRRWLQGFDFRYALLMDFRDAYFQCDPFLDVDRHMGDCDLYLMSEFRYLTIGNHPNGLNHWWIADPLGERVADSMADRPIINCGSVLGRKPAVMKLLNEVAWVTSRHNYEFVDQGAFNYLMYSGRLDHCGRIKIRRAGQSIVNNCGFSELDLLEKERPLTNRELADIDFIPRDDRGRLKLYRNPEGWVLDDDGNISSVVHQYDRFLPDMAEFVSKISDYEHPETVFVRGRDRIYLSEKYFLHSSESLKPGATAYLAERIKQLPVDSKPVLASQDRCGRDLIFSYGILHNDLLFESERFRDRFFETPVDARARDAFYANWGYTVHDLEETQVFST